MLQKALRRLLKKDLEAQDLLRQLSLQWNTEIFVEDGQGVGLWGSANPQLTQATPIIADQETLAMVRTNEAAVGAWIAQWLGHLVKKEWEKKKIGAEVLGLYREINMIYDFSEKISEKIDPASIAQIALNEALQIINCSRGSFIMLDQEEDRIWEAASVGANPHLSKDLSNHATLLKKLIAQGNSAIVPARSLRSFASVEDLESLMYAPLKVKRRTLGVILLGRNSDTEFTAAELKLLTTIALQSASAIESAYLYEKGLKAAQEREDAIRIIHEVSTKFVPFEFIRSLGKKHLTEVNLGDQVEREVTVLFADIREFTALSEELTPAENFHFVNGFNERMGPIIRKHRGFINQYLGDGFMAIFPESAQDALRASVEMHRALESYNVDRRDKRRRPVRIGVGMQMGKLIMGITGDVERMDAAIISDTVNTAARIESLSKHFGTSILLTEDCKNKLTVVEEFDFRYLGPVQLKGRQKPLKLYECINGDSHDLYQHKIDTLATFDHAMDQYFEKEFAMAAVSFQEIVKKHRGDTTAKLLLNRAAHLITKDVSDDWKGVETMHLK